MAYGIGLVFDHDTETRIREVWCNLARHGFTTPLARPGCLPHVSLTLSDTLQVDDLAREIDRFEPPHSGLEVRLSYVGLFPESQLVLFYGLTPTDALLRLQAEIECIYRRWGSAIMARTQAGIWVPHCTLAGRLDAGRCSEAIAIASGIPLPWVAHRVRLAIVQFDDSCVEVLRAFAWLA